MEYLTEEDYRIATLNNISRFNAYQRFYVYGWTKEKSINTPVYDRSFFKEYKKKCEKIGLKYGTFKKRIQRGIKPEEALYLPAQPKLTQEMLDIAEHNGIGRETVKIRVRQYKWSVERALTEPVHEKFRRKA